MNTQAAPLRAVVARRADQRGVAVGGERDARAEPAFPELSPVPVSFGPCWLQTPPERVNTHAAPLASLSSPAADQRRVAVGGERDEHAEFACCRSSPPVSFAPCWLQTPPERVNTHAAPVAVSSSGPPISAVLPSAESATLVPNSPSPVSPRAGELCALLGPGRARAREHPRRARAGVVAGAADQRRVAVGRRAPRCSRIRLRRSRPPPVSFSPCWVQVEPERVNTHAAPVCRLSSGPADQRRVAVGGERHAVAEFAVADLARAGELFALLGPGRARAREHPRRAAEFVRRRGPPISAVLPSADSATLEPNFAFADSRPRR